MLPPVPTCGGVQDSGGWHPARTGAAYRRSQKPRDNRSRAVGEVSRSVGRVASVACSEMKPSVLVLPTLLLVACSSPGPVSASKPSSHPTASAAASPSATPAPNHEQLLVVLESSGGPAKQADTIAIAGLDGVARAKAHFKPRSVPWILPDLGALLPQVAHVAARRAYYVDGDGVVRSLGADGSVREETRFPVTDGQQEVSFAVSQDGRDLVGAVVTLPAEPKPPPTPGYFPSAPYAMDVFTATSGSSAVVAYHRTWTYHDNLGSGAQFVAWDVAGPVATWPSGLGTQGGGPHQWNGAMLVHFPGGRPGAAVPAPAGCTPWDLLPSGVFLCGGSNEALMVLGPDGSLRWRYTGTGGDGPELYGFLSPDAERVVALGSKSPTVYSASDPPITMPDGFFHSGWIDSRTVAGITTSGDFAFVSLASPGHVTDLGFKGQFVEGLAT